MATNIPWLPNLVCLEECNGNWDVYLELIYRCFYTDFVENKPSFEGKNVSMKRYPMHEGKEATFWHIISEGTVEEERNIDLRRSERIKWPRPVIENRDDAYIKIWENKRDKERRVCILLDAFDYIVVIARRTGYNLFWAAYPITYPHHKRKLLKEYEAYIKANAA